MVLGLQHPRPAKARLARAWSQAPGSSCGVKGIMENKWKLPYYKWVMGYICRGYIRIMEEKVETAVMGYVVKKCLFCCRTFSPAERIPEMHLRLA